MEHVTDRHEWFRNVMAEREQFFDKGYTAVYQEPGFLIMFWKTGANHG